MALADPDGGPFIPIGGGRNPDGTTVNGGRPISWNGLPLRPMPGVGGGGGGRGLGAMLAPGSWTSATTNSHPFQGLQSLLQSSILSRLMSQRGVEGSEIRGLQGGGIAWNHLEDPYGRLTTTTNTFRPGALPAPPRKRLLDQVQASPVLTKVLDENGYPVEANPGPFKKIGLNADGTPTQYKNAAGQNIPNPYL